MKKKSKEEIQKELKGTLLSWANEMLGDKYFIDDINWENDILEEGSEDGYRKYRDTGGRTLLVRYREKLKGIKEIMKKAREDIKKNEKEKEELEEMELERIKKRIDETLDKGYVIESSGRLDEDEIEGIKFLIEEYRKALNIYKALVIKVDEICHGHLPFTTMRMTQAVQDLEEKFYPKPKEKLPMFSVT